MSWTLPTNSLPSQGLVARNAGLGNNRYKIRKTVYYCHFRQLSMATLVCFVNIEQTIRSAFERRILERSFPLFVFLSYAIRASLNCF